MPDDYLEDRADEWRKQDDHQDQLNRARHAPATTTNEGAPLTTTKVDPETFHREQAEKHAHVQVHPIGPRGARAYIVIGYDDQWQEIERTRLTEDGTVLSGAELYTVPDPLTEQENRDAS